MIYDTQFTYRPIGTLRSPYARRIDAPHQPTVVAGTERGRPAASHAVRFLMAVWRAATGGPRRSTSRSTRRSA